MFFFFSSRRRHTRCSRDWSSDVCSSDLPLVAVDCRPVHGSEFHQARDLSGKVALEHPADAVFALAIVEQVLLAVGDRKSTRLNSSHGYISYAVFCLKKKTE